MLSKILQTEQSNKHAKVYQATTIYASPILSANIKKSNVSKAFCGPKLALFQRTALNGSIIKIT